MGAKKVGTRTPRSVGAYGSKRGVPNKQVRRTELRYEKKRVSAAIKQASNETAALNARLELERAEPAVGETDGARYARHQRELEAAHAAEQAAREQLDSVGPGPAAPGPRFEPYDGDPRKPFTIGACRRLVQQGYTVPHVMRMTGIGFRWLDDLRIDHDGRLST